MTINYENTIDDVIAFSEVFQKTVGRKDDQRKRIFNTVLVFGLLFIFLIRDGWIMATIVPFVIAALIFFSWPSLMRSQIQKQAKKMYLSKDAKWELNAHEITIEEHGLRETDRGSETFYKWERIKALMRTDQHVFIYLGGIVGHIIPVARTNGDVSVQEFIEVVSSRTGLEVVDA